MEYPGFSFQDKKQLKVREEEYWKKAMAVLESKLGAGWRMDIDWAAWGSIVPDQGKFLTMDGIPIERTDLGNILIQKYCGHIAEDVEKWEPDLCEAVNAKITKKRIIVKVWDADPSDSTNFKVDHVDGEIVIWVKPKLMCYGFPYSSYHPSRSWLVNSCKQM